MEKKEKTETPSVDVEQYKGIVEDIQTAVSELSDNASKIAFKTDGGFLLGPIVLVVLLIIAAVVGLTIWLC